MKKLLALAAVAALLSSCGVNPDKGRAALEAQGITNIEIGSYSFFGCSKGDSYSSSFTGTGANGKPVSGVLCGGILKGITVRYD